MRKSPIIGIALAALLLAPAPAWADDTYPQNCGQFVKIVVGAGAGGASDVVSRVIAAEFQSRLKMNFVVENRPLGGGTIAWNEILKGKPDGCNILAAFNNPTIEGLALLEKPPYKGEDFEIVGCFSRYPLVLVVRADSGISSVKDLVDLAKKTPKGLTMGSTRMSGPYMHAVDFIHKAGISGKVEVATYNALPLVVGGLLGADGLTAAVTFGGLALPHTKEKDGEKGKLKILAVFDPERSTLSGLENVPTLKEAGVDGVEPMVNFMALAVPKGTPPEIVKTLRDALSAMQGKPGTDALMKRMTMTPMVCKPGDLEKIIREQRNATEKFMARFNIKKQ